MFGNKPKAIIPLNFDGLDGLDDGEGAKLYEVRDKRNWRGEKYTEFTPVKEDSKDAKN